MPRLIARNYRALAESQNRASWADLGSLNSDPMVRRALPEVEESAHRLQNIWLQERRARLVEEINRASQHPAIFFNHRYFRHCQRAVISSDDAVSELRRLIVKNRMKRGHWSFQPGFIPQLQEALVFARWFRRFGKRIWVREAA